MNKEIANFFWNGTLSIYEKKCIESFVKNNFIVRVWSNDKLQDLPNGAELCDASKIIPQEILEKTSHPSGKFENVGDNHLNAAAISDIFRANVGSEIEGWYFDTDCFCLKDQSEFTKLRENKPLVVAHEDPKDTSYINNAIMYLSSEVSVALRKAVYEECVRYNYKFTEWAQIGPILISRFIAQHGLTPNVISHNNFYSIYWTEMNLFASPELLQIALLRNKDSYVTHLWNSQLVSHKIKPNLPPEGSYLDYLFKGLE